MKYLVFTLLIALLAMPANAQESVLIEGDIESGGYGALHTSVGNVNGQTGVFIGGQGAWIINHRIGLGGKGYGLVNTVEVDNMENIKLDFGCGGVLLEYIIASDKLIHCNVNSMIGGGGVKYAVIDYQESHTDIDYSEDSFFVFEPGVDLILNVNHYFRIGVGATYRVVSGVNYGTLSNSDFSGVAGHLVLKFGSF